MQSHSLHNQLYSSELFHGLTQDEIQKLITRGLVVQYDEGEVIFHQGSIGSQLYIIIQGTVGVYKDEQLIAILGPSEIFGEMGVFTKQPRSATTKALQRSEVLVLGESIFEQQINKKLVIRLLLNVISILSNRLRERSQDVITKLDK